MIVTESADLLSILKPFQLRIDKTIESHLKQLPKSPLAKPYEYALTNGGKRFRPALVYMIADALGNKLNVDYSALAIELFHTASLIADDLPCMDDDSERRSRPSLHCAFDESTALLTSYAMISDGYACITANAQELANQGHPDYGQICLLASNITTYNTGLAGAVGGQYLDLNPPDFSVDTLLTIIEKKTVALFEISFVLGWLYSGGKIQHLDEVKMTARHFGLAFQLADDLQDLSQDAMHKQNVNFASIYGKERALEMFHSEIKSYEASLDKLGIASSHLLMLSRFLEQSI